MVAPLPTLSAVVFKPRLLLSLVLRVFAFDAIITSLAFALFATKRSCCPCRLHFNSAAVVVLADCRSRNSHQLFSRRSDWEEPTLDFRVKIAEQTWRI